MLKQPAAPQATQSNRLLNGEAQIYNSSTIRTWQQDSHGECCWVKKFTCDLLLENGSCPKKKKNHQQLQEFL